MTEYRSVLVSSARRGGAWLRRFGQVAYYRVRLAAIAPFVFVGYLAGLSFRLADYVTAAITEGFERGKRIK